MSLLTTLTGATSYQNIQIQNACQGLLFNITGAAAAADYQNATLRLDLVSKVGGTRPILPPTSFSQILSMGTQGNGYLFLDITAPFGAKGYVPFNNDASVSLDADTYVSLQIANATAATSFAIYTIETPAIQPSMVVYDVVSLNATASPKKVAVLDYDTVCITSANVTEVRLEYNNGRSCTYTNEELLFLARLQGDFLATSETGVVQNPDGAILGFITFNIAKVSALYITNTAASTNVLLSREVNI